jgi:diaminopimelate epimerase
LIEFTKVHENGNDFIVLENLKGKYSSADLSHLAKLLCRRKFSIGADGLLVVEQPKGEGGILPSREIVDFSMRVFNPDGSEAEMYGNGARAIARYAFERKLARASMRLSSLAGVVRVQVDPPYAELDMGEIPLTEENSGNLTCRGFEFPFSFLTVGSPHCVLFVKDYDAIDDALKIQIGREISHDFSRFHKGSNISFAQAVSNGEIRSVTYERGVEDLTQSCGAGCVAVALAFARASAKNSATPAGSVIFHVRNPGGLNDVRLAFAPGGASFHAWLKGKTVLVAEGQIIKDALLEATQS